MIYHDVIQGSDEWHKLRSTRFTASNFPKLFMKDTTKTYQNLINEIVFARLTGEVEENYQNEHMRRGIELEPEAIESYELLTFNKVNRIGFIELDEWVGCSPDGLVGNNGMIQIKCPKASTLMDYYERDIDKDYLIQMQGELYVSGREWNDYYVYHPKLKPILKRVYQDNKITQAIATNLAIAINYAILRINQLK